MDILTNRARKIKVCGMRDTANILEIAALEPDYMGFIFYPLSSRYAGEVDAEIVRQLPSSIKKTGVFVNADLATIAKWGTELQLDAVQLHGNESPEFCLKIKEKGIEVIKAFGIHANFDFKSLENYLDAVDYFLFDTSTAQHGGSGKVFDWELLRQNNTNKPFFLSGGIDLDQLDTIAQINDSRLYAVDLNSKFELSPGIKDYSKLKKIFK